MTGVAVAKPVYYRLDRPAPIDPRALILRKTGRGFSRPVLSLAVVPAVIGESPIMTGRIGLSPDESEVLPLAQPRLGKDVARADEEKHPSISLILKHFARALNRGQKITCNLSTGDNVTGYIAGHDDLTFYLLVPGIDEHTGVPRFTRKIVKRAHVTSVDLHDEATLQDEPCREEMERIFSAYRTRMVRDYLGRRTSPGGSS